MPRTPIDIRSLARRHTRIAIKVLVGIIRSEDATAAVRRSAAIALLGRGWGKATKPIEGGEAEALKLIDRIERIIVHPRNSDR